MEIKKSPQADLENKRGSFILIGLVMVLSILFIAFEWTQTEVSESMDLGIETVVIEEEMVSTEQEEEEPEEEIASVEHSFYDSQQNEQEFDGIYEIKFDDNLECIYFKSWEMIK